MITTVSSMIIKGDLLYGIASNTDDSLHAVLGKQ